MQLGIPGGVQILCGQGNNGGDGFVIARHLALQGVPVETLLVGAAENLAADAAANYRIFKLSAGTINAVDENGSGDQLVDRLSQVGSHHTAWIIDCLLGTGAKGPLRAPLDRVIDAANRCDARRLAIDIPTGVDCDTGVVQPGAFKADETFTFVARKSGMERESARPYCGKIRVISIGVPRRAIVAACQI